MSLPLPPVLVVDDEKNMRLSLRTVLSDEGYAVRAVESAEEALQLLAQEEFFMVITDARLGGMSGYEFLARAREQWPELPVLMITAYATPKLAVEAIKAGAIDYLAKPFAPEELLHAVAPLRRALPAAAGKRRPARPRRRDLQPRPDRRRITEDRELRQLDPDRGPHRCPGADPGRKRHRQGTGGRRPPQPEQPPQGQLRPHQLRRHPRDPAGKRAVRPREGRLHRRAQQKPGRVEEADGGTIFLDEIADMSRPLQAKLLRFLEDGTFTRVGGTQELRVNVRLIAATNRDIIRAIREDQFREDLFHRLNVVQMRLPPLARAGRGYAAAGRAFPAHFRASR